MLIFLANNSLATEESPYFPSDKVDEFRQDWYSKHLKAMNQKPLYTNQIDKKAKIYRFTCLPTFSNPFCVVVNVDVSGVIRLDSVVNNGYGGYAPGTTNICKATTLNAEKTKNVFDGIMEFGFWKMETNINGAGLDGSQLIFEGVNDGKYHIIDRWSPGTDSAYYKFCQELIKLSGIEVIGY